MDYQMKYGFLGSYWFLVIILPAEFWEKKWIEIAIVKVDFSNTKKNSAATHIVYLYDIDQNLRKNSKD